MNIKKITVYACLLILSFNFVGCTSKKQSLDVALATSKIAISIPNKDYTEIDIPQYKFIYNVIKDAHVIEYKNFKIIKPLYMDLSKQSLTYEQIAEQFKKLPKVLTENVKEIQLLDYNSPADKYWQETYNTKDFVSYAGGLNNRIYFYANDHFSNSKNFNKLLPALIHEAGHLLDVKISSEENRFSNSNEWILLMADDMDFRSNNNFTEDYGVFCSLYSQSRARSSEDFAESVMQYVLDKEKFIKEYPNRSEKLKKLLNDKS